MMLSELTKVVLEAAQPFGYKHKGCLFWKTGPELTTLIQLQKSSWHRGIYVNFGVMPTSMVTKAVPPGPSHWPISARGEGMEGSCFDRFSRCSRDAAHRMPASEMRTAIKWVLDWIEEHLTNDAVVRKAVLNRESWIRNKGLFMQPMTDWANGVLAAPTKYFPESRYYGGASKQASNKQTTRVKTALKEGVDYEVTTLPVDTASGSGDRSSRRKSKGGVTFTIGSVIVSTLDPAAKGKPKGRKQPRK